MRLLIDWLSFFGHDLPTTKSRRPIKDFKYADFRLVYFKRKNKLIATWFLVKSRWRHQNSWHHTVVTPHRKSKHHFLVVRIGSKTSENSFNVWVLLKRSRPLQNTKALLLFQKFYLQIQILNYKCGKTPLTNFSQFIVETKPQIRHNPWHLK